MNNDTDDEEVFSTSVCVRSGKGGGGGGVVGRKSLLALISFFYLLRQSIHAYENHVDDGPKMCEESSNYDRLRTGSSLLKDEDCTLGNISVSKI